MSGRRGKLPRETACPFIEDLMNQISEAMYR